MTQKISDYTGMIEMIKKKIGEIVNENDLKITNSPSLQVVNF